jgi:hypothetical protein
MPEQLTFIPCPEEVKYLWEYFKRMNKRRTTNGYSVNPITDEGVEAWARRRGIVFTPFENDMLDALEAVYLSIKNKAKK